MPFTKKSVSKQRGDAGAQAADVLALGPGDRPRTGRRRRTRRPRGCRRATPPGGGVRVGRQRPGAEDERHAPGRSCRRGRTPTGRAASASASGSGGGAPRVPRWRRGPPPASGAGRGRTARRQGRAHEGEHAARRADLEKEVARLVDARPGRLGHEARVEEPELRRPDAEPEVMLEQLPRRRPDLPRAGQRRFAIAPVTPGPRNSRPSAPPPATTRTPKRIRPGQTRQTRHADRDGPQAHSATRTPVIHRSAPASRTQPPSAMVCQGLPRRARLASRPASRTGSPEYEDRRQARGVEIRPVDLAVLQAAARVACTSQARGVDATPGRLVLDPGGRRPSASRSLDLDGDVADRLVRALRRQADDRRQQDAQDALLVLGPDGELADQDEQQPQPEPLPAREHGRRRR